MLRPISRQATRHASELSRLTRWRSAASDGRTFPLRSPSFRRITTHDAQDRNPSAPFSAIRSRAAAGARAAHLRAACGTLGPRIGAARAGRTNLVVRVRVPGRVAKDAHRADLAILSFRLPRVGAPRRAANLRTLQKSVDRNATGRQWARTECGCTDKICEFRSFQHVAPDAAVHRSM